MSSEKILARFHRMALSFLCLMLGGGVLPVHGQIDVSKETKDEGGGKNVSFTFPDAAISYIAKEDGNGGVEKESRLFGLSFQRPRATNGGWSLWDFLRVKVRAQDQSIAVIEGHLLSNAEILEDQQRVLLALDWRLPDQGVDLRVLFAWYPEQPDWIFVKVQCEGDGVFLEQIDFNAFPGNSAGPEERERWMATDQLPGVLLPDSPEEVAADSTGFVFFNRFAQEESGCLLVMGEETKESVKIGGGYGVSTVIGFAGDQTEAQFALGGFVEHDAEDVIRVFAMEGARNTRNYLKTIDWTPKIDQRMHQGLLRDMEELIRQNEEPATREEFQNLKSEYEAGLESGRNADLLGSVRKLVDLKMRLIEGELAKLK